MYVCIIVELIARASSSNLIDSGKEGVPLPSVASPLAPFFSGITAAAATTAAAKQVVDDPPPPPAPYCFWTQTTGKLLPVYIRTGWGCRKFSECISLSPRPHMCTAHTPHDMYGAPTVCAKKQKH